MGKLTISMAIFNSYVKLPEGSHKPLRNIIHTYFTKKKSLETAAMDFYCSVVSQW